jgi:hypothetical protein
MTFGVHEKAERSDDPLDRMTTSEAIRRLVASYSRSQYYYAAREKVNDISRMVRFESSNATLCIDMFYLFPVST